MGKKISQAEARRLRRKVQALEDREQARMNPWRSDYPDGVHLCTTSYATEREDLACMMTARKLACAVVAVPDSTRNEVRFYGVRL
jgi:hypothetical protein